MDLRTLPLVATFATLITKKGLMSRLPRFRHRFEVMEVEPTNIIGDETVCNCFDGSLVEVRGLLWMEVRATAGRFGAFQTLASEIGAWHGVQARWEDFIPIDVGIR